MAITINGSGTITGISTGGIPDGVVDTDVLADNAVTFGKIGTTEQGQLCKAWVNFDGTGTVAIRASYNVSSITDNNPGEYTVNFTTALADENYSTVCTSGSTGIISGYGSNTPQTTSTVSMQTINTAATKTDAPNISVAIFR